MSDTEAPNIPVGVCSVTGDQKVTLYWYPNTDNDLAGYNIYWSPEPEGPYEYMGCSKSAFYADREVENGLTYFYAVTAYDCSGNESELSEECVFDTPRPEGRGVRIWDANLYEFDSGYDFSTEYVQPWDESSTDIYCIYDDQVEAFYMVAADRYTDIQDFGYMDDLDAIDYAPEDGWSQTGVVELIFGHGYIVWTDNNHFAKFRVTSIRDNYLKFDWAYQEDRGNPELAPNPDAETDSVSTPRAFARKHRPARQLDVSAGPMALLRASRASGQEQEAKGNNDRDIDGGEVLEEEEL
jgi:hypothetical protein